MRLQARHFIRDQGGQSALLFVLLLLAFFMLFALALDAGFWYFDHRWAQNQAEAAALAGAYRLPNADTTNAQQAVRAWFVRNGFDGPMAVQFGGAGDCTTPLSSQQTNLSLVRFCDWNGDGRYDTIQVGVRRQSLSFLAGLFSVPFSNISALATARVGPANTINVMPWAIAQTSNGCNNQNCFGVQPGYLYSFKCDEQNREECRAGPGNTGSIGACGANTNDYRDCITGDKFSDGFTVGEQVEVDTKPGLQGQNTHAALTERVRRFGENPVGSCDIPATPALNGSDPSGWNLAYNKYQSMMQKAGNNNWSDPCWGRVVILPIIDQFPNGKKPVKVLAFATFYIAGWDRRGGSWGDVWASPNNPAHRACSDNGRPGKNEQVFWCGVVWGYFLPQVYVPPQGFLAEQLGTTDNPFAPLVVFLID